MRVGLLVSYHHQTMRLVNTQLTDKAAVELKGYAMNDWK
jgi:hypothetical protein